MIERAPSFTGPLFVPILHGLRGIAVMGVVLFHVAGGAEWVPNDGFPRGLYEGSGPIFLDALFFTTGFVLFLPVVLRGAFGSVGGFAIRRYLRLAPAYYVCMLLVAALFPLLSSTEISNLTERGLDDFLIHFSFLHREITPENAGFGVNAPAWALSMDFAFYIVLPLIASIYLRHPLAGLAAALGIALVWRAVFIEPDTPAIAQQHVDLLVQPPLFLGDFAAGMTAAWAFVRLRARDRPPIPGWALIAVASGAVGAAIGLIYYAGSSLPYHLGVFQDPAPVRLLVPLTLLAFAVSLSLAPLRVQWPLANRPIVWFGEISYSVYLYHFPIIFFGIYTLGISRDGTFSNLLLWAAYVVPVAIAVGALSYLFIERPSRRFARRLEKRLIRGDRGDRGAPASGAPAPAAVVPLEEAPRS